MTAPKAPARRCTWHDCLAPVAFELPNLLAGSRRDYCVAHASQVCMARGTVLVACFGPQQPVLPGLPDAPPGRRPGRTRRRGVMS